MTVIPNLLYTTLRRSTTRVVPDMSVPGSTRPLGVIHLSTPSDLQNMIRRIGGISDKDREHSHDLSTELDPTSKEE